MSELAKQILVARECRLEQARKGFPARGFTIVELLVVIAIIGVLVAILLPAVNGVRQAAYRTQNVNNLRQLGTALQSYEEAKKSYPPLIRYPEQIERTEENRDWAVSWAYDLLPYLEQQNLYDAWNRLQPMTHASNRTLLTMPISLFANPQKRDAAAIAPVRSDRNLRGSNLDYAANGGMVVNDQGQPERLANDPNTVPSNNPYDRRFHPRYSGPFHPLHTVTQAMVKDGVSNTIAFGDRWIGPPVVAGAAAGWHDLAGMIGSSLPTLIRYSNRDTDSGAGLAFPLGIQDQSLYKFGGARGSDCCFTFLDGRVIWLSYETDWNVYANLSAINDGNPIPPLD